jgi:hypothetical protein
LIRPKSLDNLLIMSAILTFTTGRLILRPVTLADAPAWTRHFVDYAVISQLSAQVPWPYPANGVHDYLKNMILPQQGVNR